jgi:hypothetical protein
MGVYRMGLWRSREEIFVRSQWVRVSPSSVRIKNPMVVMAARIF